MLFSQKNLSSAYSTHVKPIVLNFSYPAQFQPVVQNVSGWSLLYFSLRDAWGFQQANETGEGKVHLDWGGWGADNEVAHVVNRMTKIMDPHLTDGL